MNSRNSSEETIQEFIDWLNFHRGVKDSTLENYRSLILRFLLRMKGKTQNISTSKLRRYIADLGKNLASSSVKTHINAIRMFLKFLAITGRVDPNMINAIPQYRQPTPESLPKYIDPEDIETLVSVFDENEPATNSRNKAIILMLMRLGLRASEVCNLTLEDINWEKGTIRVSGKSRKKSFLPLPQDVGDSVINYLQTSRPTTNSNSLFVRAVAPHIAVTRSAIKGVAIKAICKAGIKSPSMGAHVFRHTAATQWLRNGLSLQAIGIVLRHNSMETTAQYAKVDLSLLSEVIQPWPAGE